MKRSDWNLKPGLLGIPRYRARIPQKPPQRRRAMSLIIRQPPDTGSARGDAIPLSQVGCVESSERTIAGTVILLPVRPEDSSEALPQTVETVAQFGVGCSVFRNWREADLDCK